MMDRNKSISGTPPELQELFILLQRLKNHFDLDFLKELDRSLPFADLLFDRWERAKLLKFGEGSSVYDSAQIF